MNLSKQYLYELPFPKIDKDEQETIAKKMKLADDEIAQLEKKVPNTQEVIQRVFEDMLGYIPSEEYITKGSVFFRQSLQRIGRGKYIRSGARYSFFWNKYNGLIFETKKQFEPSELGKLMRPHKTTIFKKGFLPQRYILIDKEDIEPKTGVIMNEEYVEKIESSKVLFGDSDILVSKIDPFLGHVILNEKEKPFIGTTELVPYIINKEKAYLKFIQYVLLSKNFLNLSEKIMAGKRQPRIMPYELLELKIPLPPRTLQEEAAKKIEKEIGDLKAQKTEIENAMKKRETSFIEYLRNSGHQPKGNSLIEKAYQPKK
jgi:restriction endonuclease S subunit